MGARDELYGDDAGPPLPTLKKSPAAAAHCGAQDRGVPLRADPRCSCAAVGEPAGGGVPAPRFADP